MPDSVSNPVPLSLFHTGRAQCPDCGAPLSLTDAHPLVTCHYCGGSALVERRLRTIEPVLGSLVTLDAPQDDVRRSRPSPTINAIAQDESHCPTCGAELGAQPESQAIRTCPHCRTESKIERRLVRRLGADEELAEMEKTAQDFDRRRMAETEKLIARIEQGTTLLDRVRAAHELSDNWGYVNAAAARLLPRMLQILRRAEAPLDIPLSELIGKLLCEGDVRLARGVLLAAEKVTFDIEGSRSLLWQLGLGEGICLKLLLDTADYAAEHGGTEYACAALWACNTIFERNYANRISLAEIVLYRLLYLRGPVQAWALQLVQGQMGLGVRFPTPTLLRFMDDCAAERPELIPHIQKCFYNGGAKDDAEYFERMAFIDQLMSPAAKCSALIQIYAPPREMPEAKVGEALEKLLAFAKDPALAEAACRSISEIIEDYPGPREAVHAMVRAYGDALPEAVRRSYLRQVPDYKSLAPLKPDYWQPEREGPGTPFDQQLKQWNEGWRAGIIAAVDYRRSRQKEATEFWATQKNQA